ncbi:MAG: aminopeptidase, partial [Clostridia bacterium]|nr:aminopeptidase [Clostridia bacterium]
MAEKSKTDKMKEELFYTPSNAFYTCTDREIGKAMKFCEGYIDFLNACRTEREVNAFVKESAVRKGYREFDRSAKYAAGDKVYFDIHG